MDEYMKANRANWDQRAPAHAMSPGYNVQARILVAKSGDDVTFVESNVYDAASALSGEKFDLVFTGIGALCWLPSISRWAATVAALLKPGGRLFIREGHPDALVARRRPPGRPSGC